MREKEYPENIFHYTTVEKLFLILGEFKLKMNTLSHTNDPREKMEFNSTLHVSAKHAHTNINVLRRVNFENNTITCFSADSEEVEGYNLPTMWAHYADKFKGVLLEICTNKFVEENSVEEFRRNLYFKNVRYETQNSKIVIAGDFSSEELIQRIFFSKRKDWDSEQEWRLLSLDGQKMCDIKNSLKAIILGLDFNNAFIPSIMKLISNKDITLKQLRLNNDTQNFYTEILYPLAK
jgi:hypothetical protein